MHLYACYFNTSHQEEKHYETPKLPNHITRGGHLIFETRVIYTSLMKQYNKGNKKICTIHGFSHNN